MSARLKLLVTEAWRSLGANLSTTVAATMTVRISMFMLGLFICFGTWMDSWSTHVKSELLVKIYFMPNATIGPTVPCAAAAGRGISTIAPGLPSGLMVRNRRAMMS